MLHAWGRWSKVEGFAIVYRDICSRCWDSSSKTAPTKDAVSMSFACTPPSAQTLHTFSTLAGEMFIAETGQQPDCIGCLADCFPLCC